ncbi:ABC transporter, putative, partial [Bodo saltans]
MNLLQLSPDELEQLWTKWEKYLVSPESFKNLSVKPLQSAAQLQHEDLDKRVGEKGSDFMTQLTQLTARSLRQFIRDPGALIGRIVQTIFFAVLVGLFFFGVDNNAQGVQDRAGVLFMVMINNIFMAAMAGISSFPPERAVFLMEQSSENYSAWTYSFAKTMAELPFQIAFPILFVCIMYFMVGFVQTVEAFFKMLLMIVLIGNLGYSFGLLTASLFSTPEISMAMVPLVMLPFMIVA